MTISILVQTLFPEKARGGKVRLTDAPFLGTPDSETGNIAPTKFDCHIIEREHRNFLEKWRDGAHPARGDEEIDVNLVFTNHLLPLVSNEPGTMNAGGPDAIRDLRILARLGRTGQEQNVDAPFDVAAGALKYSRWLSAAGDNPRHVDIRDRGQAFMSRPKG